MPTPTQSALHVNRPLTDVLIAYTQDEQEFAAGRAFSEVGVMKASDIIPQWDRGDMLRDEMARRAPTTKFARVGLRNDNTLTYSVETFGLEFPVDDDIRANQDEPYDLDQAAAVYLGQKILLKRELEFVTRAFTTGIWTGSSTATDLVGGTDFGKWSDATSTPIEDVKRQKRAILKETGRRPNVMVMGQAGWDALSEHPDVVDRMSIAQTRVVTRDLIASLFEIDEVVVSGATRNVAAEGRATDGTLIFGNNALLVYRPPAGQRNAYLPAAGYTFAWQPYTPLGSTAVSTYRDESVKSDIHRVEAAWDIKVVGPALGAFFQTVI